MLSISENSSLFDQSLSNFRILEDEDKLINFFGARVVCLGILYVFLFIYIETHRHIYTTDEEFVCCFYEKEREGLLLVSLSPL